MNRIVFDASAAIALINNEIGNQEVINHLKHGIISTVNFSETVSILCRANISVSEAREIVKALFTQIVDFDEDQACIAAEFKIISKKYGLSFGDCACLALARSHNLVALTADRAWKDINLGIKIILIR